MNPMLKRPILEGAFWLVFVCTALALTTQFDGPVVDFKYSAAAWPRVVIIVIGLCAVFQLAGIIAKFRKSGETARKENSSNGANHTLSIHLKRAATFCLPLIYLLLMPRAGYYITTPFFLAGYMMVLGERRRLFLLVTTLSIYACILVFFTLLLFVPLPVGTWPGFYELSSHFIAFVKK
jgi:hypothetical protein